MSTREPTNIEEPIIAAPEGAGPLLERDYWAVLADCTLTPSAIIDHVASHFCEFPPAALVNFELQRVDRSFALGDDVDIHIRPATHCRVRVIHRDSNSFTFGTLAGHPEAGRITFGAYRNPAGDVILHIRSRARASSTGRLIGFFAIGDAMQTNTWADFIRHAAQSMDLQIGGAIHVEKRAVEETADDAEPLDAPTFIARGD
jgi:hypothetical protein